jgi:RNA polymerase sigma-70 factor (ECF subfamily)
MTDQELIEGILRHEHKAFEFLVGRYQKQVIKTAYYFIGDLAEAEDLSQEIFMEVIDSIGKFKGRSSLSTWLYRITVNRSLNVVNRNKRRAIFSRLETLLKSRPETAAFLDQEPASEKDSLEEKERSAVLYRTIAGLPENQRIAFTLHKFEQVPYCEIARIMEISLSAVESLMHRARLNLQKKLLVHFSEYSKL